MSLTCLTCASSQGSLHEIANSYSLHSCVGETNTLRSCHFRNLYLRVADGQWVYFQSPDDPPRIKVAGQRLSSTNFSAATADEEDRYFIQRSFIELAAHGDQNRQISITPVVQVGIPPTNSSLILSIPEFSVLWEFTVNAAYSYGHCMLNNWFPMFLSMHTHMERLPHQFKIFSQSSTQYHLNGHQPSSGDPLPHTCAHYTSAWSKHPITSLEKLTQEAKSAGNTWVKFSNVIIGDAGYFKDAADLVHDSIAIPNAPSIFNTLNWRGFRNAVYTTSDLRLPGTGEGDLRRKQQIVIVTKPHTDWRECSDMHDFCNLLWALSDISISLSML